jgi:hypothetical protein
VKSRAVGLVAVAQKDAEAERFAALCSDAEIALKSLAADDTHGSVQPMRFRQASIFANGAIDTTTPTSARCPRNALISAVR